MNQAIVFGVVLLIGSLSLADEPTTGPTAEDWKVYKEAKDLYVAARSAVKSVDVVFDYDSSQKKHFHYIADGPNYYVAFQVYNRDGSINHVAEEVCDGKAVALRLLNSISVFNLSQPRNPELIPPDELAGMGSGEALGYDKMRATNDWYELQSATWQTNGNERTAEITFVMMIHPVKPPADMRHPTTMEFSGPPHPFGMLKTILSSTVGYLPVSVEKIIQSRQRVTILHASADYDDEVIGGQHVFYPTSGTWIATHDDVSAPSLTFSVKSLTLNPPVDPAVLSLEPWPNQSVSSGVAGLPRNELKIRTGARTTSVFRLKIGSSRSGSASQRPHPRPRQSRNRINR